MGHPKILAEILERGHPTDGDGHQVVGLSRIVENDIEQLQGAVDLQVGEGPGFTQDPGQGGEVGSVKRTQHGRSPSGWRQY